MKQKMEKPFVSGIIAAAGSATRMEQLDKKFTELGGLPILVRAMDALAQSDWIDEVIVVVKAEEIPLVLELIHAYAIAKVRSVVAGGATRQQSVQNGIEAVSAQAQFVAIHDGARPLVSGQVVADAILDALRTGAAAAAVPVVDTIKVAGADKRILATPDRAQLFAVQTPQVFDLAHYRQAAAEALAAGQEYTDDCQMLESAGYPVYLSRGDYRNIKITTPADLFSAQALVEELEGTVGAYRAWL